MRLVNILITLLITAITYGQESSSNRITAPDDLLIIDMSADAQNNIYALINTSQSSSFSEVVVVTKMTSDRTILWSKQIGTSDQFLRAKAIQVTSNGDVLVAFNDFNSIFQTTNMTVVRMSPAGEIIWQRSYGAQFQLTEIWDLIELTNGDLVLAGVVSQSERLYDWYFVKTQADGKRITDLSLGGNNYDYISQITEATDGSIFAVGETSSYAQDGSYEAGIVHLNNNLTVRKSVRLSAPEYQQEYLNAVAHTSTGGIVFSGRFDSEHHYLFWDGQEEMIRSRFTGYGEAVNILPQGDKTFVTHNAEGLIYRFSEQDDYTFLFYQDDFDIGRGNRASVRTSNGQLWFGGWVSSDTSTDLFVLFNSVSEEAPGCSGYLSGSVDTTHKVFNTIEITPILSTVGQDTVTNYSIANYSMQVEKVCQKTCVGPPSAEFDVSFTGLQGVFSLQNAYGLDTTKITWVIDGNVYPNESTVRFNFSGENTYEVCVTVETECGRSVSCQTVNPMTTNWNNLVRNDALKIWPVPTTQSLWVEWSDVVFTNVEVIDLYGRHISVNWRVTAKNNIRLDVNNLPLGLYQVVVHTEEGKVATRSFTKQ